MNIASDTVTGASVSDAWLNAVLALGALPDRTACHLVVRVTDPVLEDAGIRTAADELSEQLGYPSVQTVANTIFPQQLARFCGDVGELGDRYRAVYPTVRALAKANRRGTYFGRLVAYPNGTATGFDQLSDLIRKLTTELAAPGPKSARYELDFAAPAAEPVPGGDDPAEERTTDEGTADGSAHELVHAVDMTTPVYVPGKDTSAMGFPCLSFCSFQIDHGMLHLVAHYRRQHLVERGYGNYLGLGRLLSYVSEQAGLEPGQLMVVAGVATVDAPIYRVRRLARRCGDAVRVELTGVQHQPQ
jgi:hypothetical protein